MLKKWLKIEPFNPPYPELDGYTLSEVAKPTDGIKNALANLLLEEFADRPFLEALIADLGWNKTKTLYIENLKNRKITGKRGDFGEILSIEIMRSLHDYLVPISKFRYRIIPGQSLPSTDALGIKLDKKNEIVEVCYLESKLRTTNDQMAAIAGHDQLLIDYQKRLPDILIFIYRGLREQNHALFGAFRRYLRSRTNSKEADCFNLSLCWEDERWTGTPIKALVDNGIQLPRLTLHVIRIPKLRDLIDEIFTRINLAGPFEDE